MNFGQIDNENTIFLNSYKRYGYATRTEMANEAFRLLRLNKEKELRKKWLEESYSSLKNEKSDFAWATIDGEDVIEEN